MNEIYKALNWQGGTIHQVIQEVKRIKAIEQAARDFGGEVAFADSIGQISKKNKGIADKGKILSDLLMVIKQKELKYCEETEV